jgi:crotonobetainyl-CoA:carnitine CoA-transferase CaiB-like acyl-CoA transferase
MTAGPPAAAATMLTGVMVLDFSRILAGPWATQTLADLGAEVIKVERPGLGDDTRRWGPPFATTVDGGAGDATYFLACNRGKRSITVDFTKTGGRAVLRKLLGGCDVLVENFPAGRLRRYELDYESLRDEFPRLIYCSITGFGQTGPYAARPGYDALVQAMGGLMSITGEADGQPGGGPQKVGVAVTDVMTGLYACNAILAALVGRTHTGRGTHIDLALLDVQVATLVNQASSWLQAGVMPQRMGSNHPSIVPYQPFRCADGYLLLAIGSDGQFAAFCKAVDRAEWAADPRFSSNAGRVSHRAQLAALLDPILRARSRGDWVALGAAHNFPCGPINDVQQVFEDSQVRARELVTELPSHRYGTVRTVANPIRYDGAPACAPTAPPNLGEATNAVLADLGFSSEEIRHLAQIGAI